MTDQNAFNLQGFTTEGTTNVLPPIQGTTQVLPTISPDGLTQGTDTVLQQTAELLQTDANGFFGAGATTNDIFGETLKSETNDFLGGQTIGTTTDTNTLFGTTQVLPATTDPNAFLNNQTLAATQYLPGTTTDTNAIFGTTQVLPGATTFGTEGTTTTTTTTQTTYGTTQGITLPGQTTFGTTMTQGEYPATIGSNDFKPGFQLPTTTTDGFGTNGPTTSDALVGYGTTAADWAAFTTTQTTPQIETTTIQPTTTNEFAFTATETQPITEAVPIETIPPPQPITIPQPQPVVIPPPQPAPQVTQIQQPLTQTQFAARIIDEDFRRGRPVYNDFKATGLRIQQPSNNNLPIRPNYNEGINRLNYGYNNTGFSRYNINMGTGLDRLARGGSYDVYGRGITPMLNNAGLTPINPTVQATGRINDFI